MWGRCNCCMSGGFIGSGCIRVCARCDHPESSHRIGWY